MTDTIRWSAVAAILAGTAAIAQTPPTSQSRTAFSRALPPMNGRDIHVKVIDVTYPPGGANASHTHPCPVVGYVLEGALRMAVNSGAEVIYKAGDTFYEAPGDVHRTSANASASEPARFLAYFTCDGDVTPLSTPLAKSPGARR